IRAITYFLRKFPAYTMTDLMEEYAIVFFTLIENSLKLDGEEYQIQGIISVLPYMKKKDAQKAMTKFGELGQPEQKPSAEKIKRDREKLRKILSGKTIT